MSIPQKAFVFIIIVSAGIAFAFLAPVKFLLNFFNDDSFFYIKTAYNFSVGYGSTFDLINTTNGYHPLWFLMLSAFFFIFNFFTSFETEFYFRAVVLLQFFLPVISLYFIYRTFSIAGENFKKQFLLFLPVFLIIVFIRDFGQENQLLCFLYSLLVFCKLKEIHSDTSFLISKVILINLIFLTRTDFLFSVIPAIILGDYLTTNDRLRRKLVASYCITLMLTAAVYFTLNKLLFGNYLTISATIKNSFPEILFFQNFTVLFQPGYLTNHFLKFALVIFSLIIFIIKRNKDNEKSSLAKSRRFIAFSCFGTLIFLILNLAFNEQSLREWYVTFPAFTAVLLFFFTLNFSDKYFLLKVCFLFSIFVAYFYLTRITNSKWDSVYDHALKLKEETSPEDRILQMDLSGITGFFSERKLINGDGLINSFEYQDHLRSNNLEKYLKDKRVNLYSTHSIELIKDQLFFTDSIYSKNIGGYDFTFPVSALVYRMPFSYDHVINKSKGEWYLFKIMD